MAQQRDGDLRHVVRSTVTDEGIEYAAIFVGPGSSDLHLAAAAGIEGRPAG